MRPERHTGLGTITESQYHRATSIAAWCALVIAGVVFSIGWGLHTPWAAGQFAPEWPVTTPWSAVLFSLLSVSALLSRRSWTTTAKAIAIGANHLALIVAVVLLLQSFIDVRGGPELFFFEDQVLRIGGRFPGMPSIQTIATIICIATGSLLAQSRRMPRVRTVLLTTAVLAGVSGAMATAATAANLRFGSSEFGFSISTGALTVLVVFAVTGVASDSAPAAVLRTRPTESAIAVAAAGVLGIPAVNLLVETVRTHSGPSGLLFSGVLFFTLSLALSWIAWYVMRAEGWRTVAETGTDAVVLLGTDGTIHEASEGITDLTGWVPNDLRGRNVATLLVTPRGNATNDAFMTYLAHPMSPMASDSPVLVRTRSETAAPLGVRLVPTIEAEGVRVVALLNDATREVEYRRRSIHDPLTGVLNRAGTLQFLRECLASDATETAVLYIDVDRFKRINDEISHAAGDEALKALAANLSRGVRSGDIVGRIGGDEFVCVLTRIHDDGQLGAVARRIMEAVEPTTVTSPLGDRPVRVSVGAAVGGPHESAQDLLSRADEALRSAKRSGRNRVEFAQANAG